MSKLFGNFNHLACWDLTCMSLKHNPFYMEHICAYVFKALVYNLQVDLRLPDLVKESHVPILF